MSEHSTESTVFALRLLMAQIREDQDAYGATLRELGGCPETLVPVLAALSDFAAGDHIALLAEDQDNWMTPETRRDAAAHVAWLIQFLLDLKGAADRECAP